MSATTTAQMMKANNEFTPIRAAAFDGRPKIPAPIIELIVIANISRRLMPRTSLGLLTESIKFAVCRRFKLETDRELKRFYNIILNKFNLRAAKLISPLHFDKNSFSVKQPHQKQPNQNKRCE
jgi:hypothetical protein